MDIVSASRDGRNSLALVLLLILSFAIGVFLETETKRERRHILPFLAVLISGLLFLQSRGAMVAIVMSLVLTTVLYKTKTKNLKKPIFTITIIFAVILFILPDELVKQIWYRVQSIFFLFNDNIQDIDGIGSINDRRTLISISFEAVKYNPMFGIGIGSFRNFSFIGYASPHNDYLYFAAEFGLIGLFLYVYLLMRIYKMAAINYKSEKTPCNRALLIAITSICIYSAFINAYDNFLIWSVYAMICATYSRLRQGKS
jgi:O-antigen ligase